MKIEIFNFTKNKIEKKAIAKLVLRFFAEKKIYASLSVAIHIVSPAKIRSLNKKFLGQDKVTDVLSFPQVNSTKEIGDNKSPSLAMGDIFVCFKQAKEQAKKRGETVQEEVFFLIEHGLKHLIGIHHK